MNRPVDVTGRSAYPRPSPPVDMRGVQVGDKARSVQIRPAGVPVTATAADITALHNTEAAALGRREKIARDVRQLRLERGGLQDAEGGQQEVGGLRRQIAERDQLLQGGTLNKAGADRVRTQVKELRDKLDAKDVEIAKLEDELRKTDDELAHVRGSLRNQGFAPPVQPTQLAAGRLREGEVAQAYNLGPKNNQKMRDPNPGGADFIPDHVAGNPTTLAWGRPYHFREIKDWADMTDTGNLSAMLDYVAITNGSRLTIYYRSNTYMSEPLRTRIEGLMKTGKVDLVPFAGQ